MAAVADMDGMLEDKRLRQRYDLIGFECKEYFAIFLGSAVQVLFRSDSFYQVRPATKQ